VAFALAVSLTTRFGSPVCEGIAAIVTIDIYNEYNPKFCDPSNLANTATVAMDKIMLPIFIRNDPINDTANARSSFSFENVFFMKLTMLFLILASYKYIYIEIRIDKRHEHQHHQIKYTKH
jgi:hypothetical protein